MLGRLRASAAVRVLALAGGLLSVVAAFGLHPEPYGADRPAAHSGMASAHADEAPHACLACRTHTAGFVAPPAGAVARERVAHRIAAPADFPSAGRLAAGELSGRSPPAFA